MKGIVMEKNNGKLILMTRDGMFTEARLPKYPVEIGDEIAINEIQNRSSQYNRFRRIAAVAAAIILFITGSYSVYGYYNPFGYVTVDINPSVEMTYNLFGRVLSISPLNVDGTIVLNKIKEYKYKPIDDVLKRIVDRAVEENYIKTDEKNVILVAVMEKGKRVQDGKIREDVEDYLLEMAIESELIFIENDKETYEIAKKDHISPGRLKLINIALENDEGIKIEDIQNKPVKEIIQIIKDNKENQKNNKKDEEKGNKGDKEQQNNGAGQNGNNDKDNNGKKNDSRYDNDENNNGNKQDNGKGNSTIGSKEGSETKGKGAQEEKDWKNNDKKYTTDNNGHQKGDKDKAKGNEENKNNGQADKDKEKKN